LYAWFAIPLFLQFASMVVSQRFALPSFSATKWVFHISRVPGVETTAASRVADEVIATQR
jgi:hypothetical protein